MIINKDPVPFWFQATTSTFAVAVTALLIGLAIFPASDSEEISNERYKELRTTVPERCPELKPIIALYIQEYKFITNGKYTTFMEQCEGMRNSRIKRNIVDDFSK